MDEFNKTLQIIEQVKKLDLTQIPVFTWDEMEKEKNSGTKTFAICAIAFLLVGILVGFNIAIAFKKYL